MMMTTPTTTMTKNPKMTCTEAAAVPAHVEKLLSTVLGSSANLSRLTSGLYVTRGPATTSVMGFLVGPLELRLEFLLHRLLSRQLKLEPWKSFHHGQLPATVLGCELLPLFLWIFRTLKRVWVKKWPKKTNHFLSQPVENDDQLWLVATWWPPSMSLRTIHRSF